MTLCKTCNHAEREQIEFALANTHKGVAGGIQRVADKWGIPKSSVHRHLHNHMTQEQVMRLRAGVPDAIDVNIEEVVRRAGEGAILALRDLENRHKVRADALERAKDYEGSRKELAEMRKCSQALVLYAGMVPGRKTVTNNNLVLGDVGVVFDLIDATLKPFPEARLAVAAAFATTRQPALEHAA